MAKHCAFIQTVRQDSPSTVCLVTAAKPSLKGVMRLIDLGVRAVIDKPFEEEAFLARVNPLLEATRAGKRGDRQRPPRAAALMSDAVAAAGTTPSNIRLSAR